MGKSIKTIFKSPIFRSAFLLLALVFIFSQWRDGVEVAASDDKMVIYPSLASVSGNWQEHPGLLASGADSDSNWKNVEKISVNDISQEGDFSVFNPDNSAYLDLVFSSTTVKAAEDVSGGSKTDVEGEGEAAAEEEQIEDLNGGETAGDNFDSFDSEAAISDSASEVGDNEESSEDLKGAGEESAGEQPVLQDFNVQAGNEGSGDEPSVDAETSVGENFEPEAEAASEVSSDESAEVSRGLWGKISLTLRTVKESFLSFAGRINQAQAEEGLASEISTPELAEEIFSDENNFSEKTESEILTLKDSIILSGFQADKEYFGKEIINTQLRLSFAASSSLPNDRLSVEYKIGSDWYEAGELLIGGSASNVLNGGHFLYALPIFSSWDKIAGLQVKVSYVSEFIAGGEELSGKRAQIYFDAAWLEVDYDGGSVKGEEAAGEETEGELLLSDEEKEYLFFKDEEKIFLDGLDIAVDYTDDNSGESLIIKSDKESYYGLTEAEVYFSVTNNSDSGERFGLQAIFPEDRGDVEYVKKLVRTYREEESDNYGSDYYHCETGWQKEEIAAENFLNPQEENFGITSMETSTAADVVFDSLAVFTGSPIIASGSAAVESLDNAGDSAIASGSAIAEDLNDVAATASTAVATGYVCSGFERAVACDLISDDGRDCLINNAYLGKSSSVSYEDGWQESEISEAKLPDRRNLFAKVLGVGRKPIEEGFDVKKSTAERTYDILPGETQYFKMKIKFPFGSNGEFYLETVGVEGYGLLDPWWNASWDYEREIYINNGGSSLSDYEIKLTINTAALIAAGRMQADCDDVRFLNTDKGPGDELDYYLEPETCNRASTIFWVEIPTVPSGSKTIYMYYGNTDAAAASNGSDTFVYYNGFESQVGFNQGSLTPTRTGASSRFGSYGIEANGASTYGQYWRNNINPGRDLVWESWVRSDSSSPTAGLPGIVVGHPEAGSDQAGYQVLLDSRPTEDALKVMENLSSQKCSDSSVSVSSDTWYYLSLYWTSGNQLGGRVYNHAASSSPILSCSSGDSSYSDGEYGIAVYDMADWDNYRVRHYIATTPTITASSSDITITEHYPTDPVALVQYKTSTSTILYNGEWISEGEVNLYATTSDKDGDAVAIYYNLIDVDDSFSTTTSVPTNRCAPGTSYSDCTSKIWASYSTLGDEGWYDDSYPYRAEVTIPGTSIKGDMPGYPVYLDMSIFAAGHGIWSGVRSTGGDIVITSADGESRLPLELVAINTTLRTGEIYFKANFLNATDYTFYIYYGSSTASQPTASSIPYGSQNVWTNYRGVWHMNNSGTTIPDSTVTGNNLTLSGTYTAGVAGRLGTAVSFTNGLATVNPTNEVLEPDDITLSVWIQRTNTMSDIYNQPVWHGVNTADPYGNYGFEFNDTSDTQIAFSSIANGVKDYNYYPGTINQGTWYYLAGMYDGANSYIYVNGTQQASTTHSAGTLDYDTSNNFSVGSRPDGNRSFVGIIDEVRVQFTGRGKQWMATEYANMTSPSTFLSESAQESRSTILANYDYQNISGVPDSSDGYKWQAMACDATGLCSWWVPFNTGIPNFRADSLVPTTPGDLSETAISTSTVEIQFGATTTETNFEQYKIFYKIGVSGVAESDSLFGSSSDANLGDIEFNGAATTTVVGLQPGATYVFNIWAYDSIGNKASSVNELIVRTKYDPSSPDTLGQFKIDLTPIPNGGWGNEDLVKFYATSTDGSVEIPRIYYEFIPQYGSFTSGNDKPLDFCVSGDAYGCSSNIWVNSVLRGSGGFSLGDWYDASYSNRLSITVNFSEVDANVTDFPVYLDLSVLNSIDSFWDNVQAGGGDLLITNSTGTRLPLELVDMNTTARTGELYFKANLSSTVDTDFYIYYGSSTAAQPAPTAATIGSRAVWSNGYVAVFHYGDTTDSVNGLTGTNNGSTENTTVARMGTSRQFVGASSQYIDYGNTGAFDLTGATPLTIQSWVRFSTLDANYQDWFGVGDTQYALQKTNANPGALRFIVYDGGWQYYDSSSFTLTTNTWYSVAGTYAGTSGGALNLYVNGARQTGADTATGINSSGYNLNAGRNSQTTPSRYLNGYMDESRIANAYRSATWISTEYNNMNDNASFFSAGAAEDVPVPENTSSNWYNTSWNYRKKITLDSAMTNVDLSDFPVLVYLSYDEDLALKARSDGYDIMFTDGTGTSTIPYEREVFNSATGRLVAWVSTDISTSSDTEIYMYYGHATSSDNQNVSGVWPTSDYASVWHSSEGGTGTRYDSTSNNNDATTVGYDGNEATANGKVGGADILNGDDEYLTVADSASLDITGNITVEGWINPYTATSVGYLNEYGYARWQFVGMKWAGGSDDCTVAANFNPETINPYARALYGSSNWDSGSFWSVVDTTLSTVNGIYDDYSIDFEAVLPAGDESAAEAYCGAYIWSPDDRTVNFSVGSDETRIVWVNGVEEHRNCTDQILVPDDSTFSVDLNSGWNTVLMRVSEDTGDWGAQWRVSSNSSGLKYTADPIIIIDKQAYQLSIKGNSLSAFYGTSTVDYQISTSSYTHFAMTGDANDLSLYTNGVLRGTASFDVAPVANASTLLIGRHFNGVIDELRIHNQKMTSDWIYASYNMQNTPLLFSQDSWEQDKYVNFDDYLSIASIPASSTGYKWRAMACNAAGVCSPWIQYNVNTPNLRTDITNPTTPGALTLIEASTTYATLQFGANSSDANFDEYRIYYKIGNNVPLYITDSYWGPADDSDLGEYDFNGTATTTMDILFSGQTYTVAIFAFDYAGNYASSSVTVFSTAASDLPPVGVFNSVAQKTDGSGQIDVSIEVDDPDNENTLRAYVAYVAGAACDFSTPLDPTIDTLDSDTTADYGDPGVNNAAYYQIGITDEWIWTSPGSNTINFDWLSASNIPNADGDYCLQLMLNDSKNDQLIPATTTITIDNLEPSAPGNLTTYSKTANSITLAFGATSTDTHFDHYEIYYRVGAGAVGFSNTQHVDSDLNDVNYNGTATTTISGLSSGLTYTINIWAFDAFGNYTPATAVQITTNYGPSITETVQTRTNSAIISNQGWTNENQIFLVATSTDQDEASRVNFYFNLVFATSTLDSSDAEPTSHCFSGASFGACSSKIWAASSSPLGSNTFSASVNVAGLPQNYTGYKWQIKACDSEGNCSLWIPFNVSTPNFSTDFVSPSVPGALTEDYTGATSTIINFGASSTEANFSRYRIYYKEGVSGVKQTDTEHTDSNMNYIDFNGAATTLVINLNTAANYVFNIYAYDLAGNVASATSELAITTEYSETPPTGIFNSAAQKTNGSGAVDISIEIDDPDNNDTLQAKIEYVAGALCDFTTPLDPALDETDANITADHGDPDIDNDETYQIGTTSAWILTSPGSNTVNFDWLAKNNLPNTEGTYCLRLTANDGPDGNYNNQITPATRQVAIDTKAPTNPGALTELENDPFFVEIGFGAQSTDVNFDKYKIYYKAGSSGVKQTDTEHVDSDMNFINYNGTASTTVSGLSPNTQYVFNIFAYDDYGNVSTSSSELVVTTGSIPSNPSLLGQYETNTSTPISLGGWINANNIYLTASSSDVDDDQVTLYYQLIANSGTFSSAVAVPSNSCTSSTAYNSCSSKIWRDFDSFQGSSGWYDDSFSRRIEITANNSQVNEDLTSFPVYFNLANFDNANSFWTNVRSDGGDIRIVDSSGVRLPLEIVSISTTNHTGEIYFRASLANTTNTDFYIYYGSSTAAQPAANATYGSQSVWSNEFVSVWHFQQTSGSLADSVSGLVGTFNSTLPDPRATRFGNSHHFNGTSDYIQTNSSALNSTAIANFTWSVWFDADSVAAAMLIWEGDVAQNGWGTGQEAHIGTGYTSGPSYLHTYFGDTEANSISSYSAFSDLASWHHLVGTFSSLNTAPSGRLYLDGATFGSVDTGTAVTRGWDTSMRFGSPGVATRFFTGYMDEVRISSTTRSATWISTEYNNMNANASFFSTGTQETYTASYSNKYDYVSIPSVPELSAGYKWQVIACDENNYCTPWQRFSTVTYPHFRIDTTAPTAPGPFSLVSRTQDSITLAFGAQTTETNFLQYKIYYKEGTSTITEADTMIGSSTEPALGFINYNGQANVTVPNLQEDTWYAFAIYAYDRAGNKASSTQVDFQTIYKVTQEYYYINGSDIGWINEAFAWDQVDDTYAYRDIPGSGVDDSGNYLLGTSNSSATTTSEIIAIEVGVEGYVANTDVSLYVVPIFQGTIDGTTSTMSGANIGTSDNDDVYYVDITNLTGAPETWTWDDVQNLDLRLYGGNINGSAQRANVDSIVLKISVNYYPNDADNLEQYVGYSTSTALANGVFLLSTSTVSLYAEGYDQDTEEVLSVVYEFIPSTQSFTSSTSKPSTVCLPGTDYSSCSDNFWISTYSGAPTYFSSTSPWKGVASITDIPDGDYKWRAIACDDDNNCSPNWTAFDVSTPNVRVDNNPPTDFGPLSVSAKTSVSMTLDLGSPATEANFDEYRIYYKVGTSSVSEANTLFGPASDADLGFIDFNGTSNVTITGLVKNTDYVFNIWAYDDAGWSASSTEITSSTTDDHELRQVSYLVENDDGAGVNLNTAEVIANTSLTNVEIGQRMNIRLQIENEGEDQTYNRSYRLQFEDNTNAPGNWINVGAGTEIAYSLGFSGTNGNAVNSSKAAFNANTWVNGTWHENTGVTGNLNLEVDQFTEIVFAVQTINTSANTTYRFRLVDNTASTTFENYSVFPTIVTAANPSRKYSKNTAAALPANTADQTYYFDEEGYDDVYSDDNSNRDALSSTANYPIYLFVNDLGATGTVSISWNGQSSVAFSTRPVTMQIYRFGSTNAWETVASNITAAANTDVTLSAVIGRNVDDYFDSNEKTYIRVYQDSGTQILRTDYFSVATSSLTDYATQRHYRWRNDDAGEAGATWREAEDTADPTVSSPIEKGSNIRLRLSLSNTWDGSDSYSLGIQYATTTGNCSATFSSNNWVPVLSATTSDEAFEISSSPNFANGAAMATSRLTSDELSYVSGRMIEDPGSVSTAITLTRDQYTEVEYVIVATGDSVTGQTYCFRLTDSGAALENYDRYAKLTVAGYANMAPVFTTGPSDNGSSTTTPTTDGQNVSFTATASDSDSDEYYLAVCRTNSVTAHDASAPTCGGGNWCISSKASSTAQASCNYAANISAETGNWYAFVCDYREDIGAALCSSYSQGSGVNGSPFNVNHYPYFSNVYTSNNNQNPGSTFTIQASSTETDDDGGADQMTMYVCSTASATFAGGCGASTFCSVIATTTQNPNCQYTDTAPTPAGTTNYWVYVYDNHALAATSTPRQSSFTINDAPAELGTLVLNGGSSINLNISGAPDTSVSTIDNSVSDLNGCTDLVSATAVIYLSSATNTFNCAADNNDCYQISTGNCVLSGCSGADDFTGAYTCTAGLKYYAIPTDNQPNNPWWGDSWLSRINVYDGTSYSATTSAGVNLTTGIAIDITEEEIDFGEIYPGNNTGAANETVTLINSANSPLNTDLLGTNMSAGVNSIPVNYIEWDLAAFNYNGGVDLATTSIEIDTLMPKATSSSEISDVVYWGLGVPGLTPSDLYYGSSTFSAVLDELDW